MSNLDTRAEPLASEIYRDLKAELKFKGRLIYFLLAVIVGLALALALTNAYHIYQWSQFDTYVVDSESGGYSNLVQGDNSGGIFNGEDSSAPTAGRQG